MVGVGRGEGTRRHAIGEASFGRDRSECLADEDSDVAHDASDDVFRQ